MKIETSITPPRARRCHNRVGTVFRCLATYSDWIGVITSRVSDIYPPFYSWVYCYLLRGFFSFAPNLTVRSLGFCWKDMRDFSSLSLMLIDNKKTCGWYLSKPQVGMMLARWQLVALLIPCRLSPL